MNDVSLALGRDADPEELAAERLRADRVALIRKAIDYGFEQDAVEDWIAAAFRAAESTFRTELKGLAEQEDEGVYEVVAAFKAADVAIRKTLSGKGDLGMDEATCVLSLLLTRFGIAFSRQPGNGLMAGFRMIESASSRAQKALSDHLNFSVPPSGEPRTREPLMGEEGAVGTTRKRSAS